MQNCQAYEEDHSKYSLYIQGYFLLWLEQQRIDGKLRRKKRFYKTYKDAYDGEFNRKNKRCGQGLISHLGGAFVQDS